jgi:nucleoside-diphosphate-sugar epimerase
MIKLAVLGANGFIGTRIIEMLALSQGMEVRPIVRDYPSLARALRFDLDARVADAFDQEALEIAFQRCDVAIHAVAGDIRTILGTLAPVYYAAQKAGVQRLIYLSSGSVHGQAPQPGTDEGSALSDKQILPYNNAKVRAERALMKLRRQSAVEVVILRPGIVFGPRSSWVINFADALLTGRAALLNSGEGICNSIYVDNLVHAIYLAATQPAIDREVFLLGDQECVTWADLYHPIAEALGYELSGLPKGIISNRQDPEQTLSWFERLEPIRVSKQVQGLLSIVPHKFRVAAYRAYETILEPHEDASAGPPEDGQPVISHEMAMLYSCQYKLPHSKATQILGYQPPVSFAEGIRRTVAWLAFAGYPVKAESMEMSVSV